MRQWEDLFGLFNNENLAALGNQFAQLKFLWPDDHKRKHQAGQFAGLEKRLKTILDSRSVYAKSSKSVHRAARGAI